MLLSWRKDDWNSSWHRWQLLEPPNLAPPKSPVVDWVLGFNAHDNKNPKNKLLSKQEAHVVRKFWYNFWIFAGGFLSVFSFNARIDWSKTQSRQFGLTSTSPLLRKPRCRSSETWPPRVQPRRLGARSIWITHPAVPWRRWRSWACHADLRNGRP